MLRTFGESTLSAMGQARNGRLSAITGPGLHAFANIRSARVAGGRDRGGAFQETTGMTLVTTAGVDQSRSAVPAGGGNAWLENDERYRREHESERGQACTTGVIGRAVAFPGCRDIQNDEAIVSHQPDPRNR